MAKTRVDISQLNADGLANRVLATPDLSTGAVSLRPLTENDLPVISTFPSAAVAADDLLPFHDTSAARNRRNTTSHVLSLGLEGFISGLKAEYISATQLRLNSGVAHIQSSGLLLKLTGSTKTLSGLSANTWYYVYVFNNSGALDWEWSTTAPDTPYFGAARSKTGDTSRRFVFCFRSNGSSQLYNFIHDPQRGVVNYQIDFSVSPFRILGPGQATSWTTVSASAVVPPVSTLTTMRIQNYQLLPSNASSPGRISVPSDTVNRLIINIGADTLASVAVNSSQQIVYLMDSPAPTGIAGFYIDVKEFDLPR